MLNLLVYTSMALQQMCDVRKGHSVLYFYTYFGQYAGLEYTCTQCRALFTYHMTVMCSSYVGRASIVVQYRFRSWHVC
jgi:hypothetical protein